MNQNNRESLIQLRGLRKIYREGGRERAVLECVDADIAAGERLALVGRSGCGKSTLLNLIAAIDVPSAGLIRFDGQELTALGEPERTLFRRRHIGFVYQFFNLIPTLTVEENVRLPLALMGRIGDSQRVQARRWLAAVGLEDRRDTFPDCLSGGEQQRVAIARALVHEPTIVLADEPTGSLDADTGDQVLNLLDALVRETGKTLIMVTHNHEVAARADRMLRLDRGRLVGVGVEGETPS